MEQFVKMCNFDWFISILWFGIFLSSHFVKRMVFEEQTHSIITIVMLG